MNLININVESLRLDVQDEANTRTFVIGSLFNGGQALSAEALAVALAGFGSMAQFQEIMRDANGFYAAIHETRGHVFATVDRVRSLPLFYALQDGDIFLSDDAEWLRQQIGAREFDAVARDEFQRAGYVTGADTLLSGMKQLQAGESLLAIETEQGMRAELHRYFRFTHMEPASFNDESLKKEFAAAARSSIERLIRHAAGRQIVVPLSGGYDSRFIATLLKQQGYSNALAFTYGVPGNRESDYSKRVADALGLKWIFIEYSDELWSSAWRSRDRWQYQLHASGWCSVPHMQDWLAVRILRERGLVDSDCIFVPGHTGDFVSGGHIPGNAFMNINACSEDLLYAIKRKHYQLAPVSAVTPDRNFCNARILDRAEAGNIRSNIDYANAFEKWEWQERQAKLIINSVRVYEYYGYEWWLPLWDREFMKFWQDAPLAIRRARLWYISRVEEIYAKNVPDLQGQTLGNAGDQSIRARLTLSPYLQGRLAKAGIKLVRKLFAKRIGQTHLLWRSRYPGEEVDSLIASGYSAVGINAHDVLKSMNLEISSKAAT